MYSAEFLPDQIQSLCEEKARNWDHRLYFKRHQSNGMCVKVLFEIMSKISPKYNIVYQNIKDTIWSHWVCMVSTRGVIEEFQKHNMRIIDNPVPGAFAFIKYGKTIGHVGLIVDKSHFWHLCKKGFVRDDIKNYKIICIGVF